MTWVLTNDISCLSGEPVTIIEHVIKMGVYPNETIEEMAQEMKRFTQVALLNIDEISGLFIAGIVKFIYKALHSFSIFLLNNFNLLKKIRIETRERFISGDLDAVIYN